jgi:hypothetical protein
MKNIKNKNRIFEILKHLDDDFKNLSVNELLKLTEREIEKEKEEKVNKEKFVINTYKSTFLKIQEKHELFGESIKVIKIKNIIPYSFDTEYDRLYKIVGEEISFNKINIFKRNLNEKTNTSLSYSQLKKYDIITKEEYFIFLKKYKELESSIEEIFKQK